jgi:hypothetical protein
MIHDDRPSGESCELVKKGMERAMSRYLRSDQSSDTCKSTAVASVSALYSLGNTPTTRVRRFTSRKTRSTPFVVRIKR